MGNGVSKGIRTSIVARWLLRLFLILLLIPLFSAVKCGSLIEGEDSDAAASGVAAGSGSGSSSACSSAGSITISQTTNNSTQAVQVASPTTRLAQSFQTSANTKVSKIEYSLYYSTTGPASATLDLYSGGANPTAGTLLGSSTNTAINNNIPTYFSWTFSDLAIATGITYYAVLTHNNDGTSGVTVETQSAGVYSSGTMWTFGGGSWTDTLAADAKFRITTCD